MVRIVDEDDEDEGLTLEVEALSGRVLLHEDEVELDDILGWLPEEGPLLKLILLRLTIISLGAVSHRIAW